MAQPPSAIKKILSDTRTRNIILITLALVVVSVIIGGISFYKRTQGVESGAKLQTTPGSISDVPGSTKPTAEYSGLVAEQNRLNVQHAEQSGGSAMPTIIKTYDLSKGQDLPPCLPQDTSLTGLTDLKQTGAQPCANQNNPLLPAAGTPVFDNQGHLIGYVGADGKVRDMNGKEIGAVSADALVRAGTGNIIGRANNNLPPAGTPVYDKNGNLIGYTGADGKVRDASGKVIGTVGPDGSVRDLNGNVIAKAGGALPPSGTPVYDTNGKLLGYVGADGKVRDANGNIMGSVGPDGKVRDASGKVIGSVSKATSASQGKPIYDKDGHLIGYAGVDGKVRDANGNVVAMVGADGKVRDASGKVIADTNPSISLGHPVYDPQGHLIGYADADGKVHDLNGNVIGTVGPDGTVRDANGNAIGSENTAQTDLGGNANATTTALNRIYDQQQQSLNAQQREQMRAALQGSMGSQAQQLLTAWASPTQSLVAGSAKDDAAAAAAAAAAANAANTNAVKPLYKAGTIIYAVLDTAINTDEPGPIMATIVNGPLKGARLIGGQGSIQTNQPDGQKVMLRFDMLNIPNKDHTISINAVAIDPNTSRTAFSTFTDNHIMSRYGSLFASAFMSGLAQAVSQSGTTVQVPNSTGGPTTITGDNLNTGAKATVALGAVGQQWSTQIGPLFNRPPTIYVKPGVGMGILFLSDVNA